MISFNIILFNMLIKKYRCSLWTNVSRIVENTDSIDGGLGYSYRCQVYSHVDICLYRYDIGYYSARKKIQLIHDLLKSSANGLNVL